MTSSNESFSDSLKDEAMDLSRSCTENSMNKVKGQGNVACRQDNTASSTDSQIKYEVLLANRRLDFLPTTSSDADSDPDTNNDVIADGQRENIVDCYDLGSDDDANVRLDDDRNGADGKENRCTFCRPWQDNDDDVHPPPGIIVRPWEMNAAPVQGDTSQLLQVNDNSTRGRRRWSQPVGSFVDLSNTGTSAENRNLFVDSGYSSLFGTPSRAFDDVIPHTIVDRTNYTGNTVCYANNSPSIPAKRKVRNAGFSDATIGVLERWYSANVEHPYPNEEVVTRLASEAQLTAKQTRKWLANRRVRSFNTLTYNGAVNPKRRTDVSSESHQRLQWRRQRIRQTADDDAREDTSGKISNLGLVHSMTSSYPQTSLFRHSTPVNSVGRCRHVAAAASPWTTIGQFQASTTPFLADNGFPSFTGVQSPPVHYSIHSPFHNRWTQANTSGVAEGHYSDQSRTRGHQLETLPQLLYTSPNRQQQQQQQQQQPNSYVQFVNRFHSRH